MISQREKDIFEKRGVWEAVLRLALPTVLGQIILVIYNMADTFFVGMAGDDAMLTAVTISMPAFMFLSAISNLFGIGGASVIARALGTGDSEKVKSASAFAFWGCLAGALLYSLTVLLFLDPYVDLLGGVNPAAHDHARAYLFFTVALGGVFTSLGALLSHLIRAEGRAALASGGIMMGGLLNILLDPLFMFKILPPGQEALGAALATALSNLAVMIYFLAVLLASRRRSLLTLKFCRGMFKSPVPGDVLSAGLPACVMTLCENLSFAVLDKLMSLEGVALQAGLGVAKKINMLAHCAVRGIAQGALPLLAYNFAAGRYERMRESFRVARRLAVGLAALCMIGNLVLARDLVGLFIRQGSDSLAWGAAFLRILCLGAPFSAAAYTIISFFQATGEGAKSFRLALLRKGVLDIPLMLLLGGLIPAYGIVAATPLTDIICSLAALLVYRKYIRKLCPAGDPRGILQEATV